MSALATDQDQERVQALCREIEARRRSALKSKISRWKPRRHYASGLSTCPRQLAYNLTRWDQKTMWDEDVQAGMEDGRLEGQQVVAELLRLGFEVIEQESQLDDDRLWVTGKIDGKLKWDGRKIPCEIKRMHPNKWETIREIADLNRSEWTKKYLAQLKLYCWLHNEPVGFFLLSDGLGHWKFLVVPLDLEFLSAYTNAIDQANASPAIQKVRAGQGEAVSESDLPSRIEYRPSICGLCNFKDICLPNPTFGEGAVNRPDLESVLAELEQLTPASRRYDELRRQLKDETEGREITLAGAFAIEGHYVTKVYRAQPAKPAREVKSWEWDWKRLSAPTNGHA